MHFPRILLTALLLSACLRFSAADTAPPTATTVERRYGLDSASSLESRVLAPEADSRGKRAAPAIYPLTEPERRKLAAAFAALPPRHQRILSKRLRRLTFLDGTANAAPVSITVVNPGESHRLYDLTLPADTLHQTTSEYLTEREQRFWTHLGLPLDVSIEAGKRDALTYVLLEEATEIVESALAPSSPVAEPLPPLAREVWSDYTTPTPSYNDPIRQRIRFAPDGETLITDRTDPLDSYRYLCQTPFVSLTGSSSCHQDVIAYIAVYHWTELLREPYRIVIRKEGKKVFVYEPMKSYRVRSRIGEMPFYYQ